MKLLYILPFSECLILPLENTKIIKIFLNMYIKESFRGHKTFDKVPDNDLYPGTCSEKILTLGREELIHWRWKPEVIPYVKHFFSDTKTYTLRNVLMASCGGSYLQSQHAERPRWADHLRSRDRDHPGQHGETLSLLNIQNLAGHGGAAYSPSYSGGWGRRIAWTQEAEVAVSRDRTIALQPG